MLVDIEIRTALPEDAPAVADLAGQFGYPSAVEEVAERLALVRTAPDHAVWVACRADDEVVGWVHAFLAVRIESPLFAELGGLVVAQEQRGKGIGKRLLAAVERWAAEQGVAKLRVRSRSSRTGAHLFYARLGFVLTKEQSVFDKTLTRDDARNPGADSA